MILTELTHRRDTSSIGTDTEKNSSAVTEFTHKDREDESLSETK